MKKVLFFLFFLLSIFSAKSQTLETFESATNSASSFTNGGNTFNLSSPKGFVVYPVTTAGLGYGGSNKFIHALDGGIGAPPPTFGQTGTITIASGTFKLNNFWIYLTGDDGQQKPGVTSDALPGTVTFTGKLGGVTQFVVTKTMNSANIGYGLPANGFIYIDFASEGGSNNTNISINQLEVKLSNNYDYFAIDNFTFQTGSTAPAITANPSNSSICAGANTTFSATASDATGYQWQVNTGSGYNNITNGGVYSGATTATLAITGATAAMSGYLYRVIASGSVSPDATSTGATLTVNSAPSITSQPGNSTVCKGLSTSFTVAASNATSYRWQVNTGSGFVNVPIAAPYTGATSATLNITNADADMNGYTYRVLVTGTCTPNVTSNAVTLTVNSAPDPKNPPTRAVCAGANTTISSIVTNGTSYQWQVNTGSGYIDIAYDDPQYLGANNASLLILAPTTSMSGYAYRIIIGSLCGASVTSNGTTLTVNPAPAITAQPGNSTICSGANTTFSVTASNATGYQWQVDQGGGYANVANAAPYTGVTSSTLTITGATAGMNGYKYKLVATGTCSPAATSDEVTLTVNSAPAITAQVNNAIVCAGGNTTFEVTASNATGYQWQVNQGGGFVDINNGAPYTGATTSILTITGATNSMNGYAYRVLVTGTCSPAATSSAGTLTINPAPSITAQPSNSIICAGANTIFAATVANATGYQWQVNTGSGYNDIISGGAYSGATTGTLTITGATAGMNGYSYRLVANGACTPAATSNTATLTVNSSPAITAQPGNSTICAGANTTFEVTASNATGYIWQVNQGGGFFDIPNIAPYSGANTSILTITGVTAGMNGYVYRVVATGACTPAATSSARTLTVNPATSITAQPGSSTINALANATFSVTASNATSYQWQVNQGSGYSDISNGGVYSGATTANLNITAAPSAMNGYSYRVVVSSECSAAVNSNGAVLTVNKNSQSITFASNASVTYGATPLSLPATASSGLSITYSSSDNTVATVSGNTLTVIGAGTATITASQAGDANYDAATAVNQTLTVNAATLTITADNKTKVYGAAIPTLTASYSGFVNGDTNASLTTQPTLSTTATVASSVAGGPYAITAGGAASSNYTISYVAGTLTVNTAALTITADNKTKVYGAAIPTLTASYSGFVNGDTNASLTTQPTLSTTATAASSVAGGPYAITASGAVSSNYTISYVAGALSVNTAALTITADNKTKVYGAAIPTLTASYSGFVNGDTNANLTTQPTLSTTATAASSVAGSPYTITASGAVSSNYTISYVAGTLSVNAAALTITADNKTKVYGAAIPTLTASCSGFVNGDTNANLTTQPTLSTTATSASSVAGSPYAITASGAASSNYTISYVAGTLSVNTAALTITADNKTKVYGAAIPTLTASYSGFVNGDTNASLTTQPTLSTTATAASSVAGGPYAITASGAASSNYTISYVAGTLSVNTAALTITADNKTKVYGAAIPTLTASYSGFVNGDTNASLTTQPTLSTTATSASSVAGSPYAITASGAASSNYAISYVAGTLSVNAAALTITADNKTKVYGAAIPTLTASYSGFVNGDSNANLTTQPTLSTTATAASSVAGGPYTITANGAVSSNYTISYTAGTLTVTSAALTITADNKEKFAGTANPALTVSYSGFVNGESSTVLTTQPTTSTTAALNSPIGDYPITVGGAAAANYAISYVAGNLKIKPGAPTSITLAGVTLYENRAAGTNAGTLSSTSDDPSATFSYTLVAGTGDTDNALFTISGNKINTSASLNYENKSVYKVRVRSTTQNALWLEKELSINLTDVNEVPTLAAINNQTICFTTTGQAVALTGISAGEDAGQTTTLAASSNNAALFESLTVTGSGATGTLNYRIKAAAIAGTATVTVTVKDNGGTANGGIDTYTRTFVITVNALPVVSISSDKGTTISKGDRAFLSATGGTTYAWANSAGVVSGLNSATLEVRPKETTTYTVTVKNASGCEEVKSFTLTVLDDFMKINANNIMTPNGDGVNDKWVVDNIDFYPNNEVKIFDKAGRFIYGKKGYDNSWDGTLNGLPLAESTYYYIIDFGNRTRVFKGFITIVRND